MKRETFKASDGKELSVAVWDDVKSPRAAVLIAHGMAEHIERYDEFANYLQSHGCVVLGGDHRAHGKTDEAALGHSLDNQLFSRTVLDLIELTDMAKHRYDLPIILFGHSYGSFLAQEYITRASDKIAALVLSGSAMQGKFMTSFGHFVARRKCKKGAHKSGNFFANLTFNSYDKKFGEGKNAWLSNNAESNAKYTADSFCGFTCSNGFYEAFMLGLKKLSSENFAAVRKDLPILIAYGSCDCVSNRGKLITKLEARFKKAKLNYKTIRYEGARHEILNETNKANVFNDILEFITSCKK